MHGQVALERRGAEVLVHRVIAGEHRPEGVGPDGDHERQADRGRQRVAPADPVPEPEHVLGRDAERRDLLLRSSTPPRSACDRRLVAQGVDRPVARGVGVRERLERRERLGDDDEERLGGIEAVDRLGELGAVDVGDEADVEVALALVQERLVRHRGAEIGPADADVHDGADRLAGVPDPRAGPHPVGELRHPVEDRVDLGDHVLPVDDELAVARHAQRHVADGAVLGHVDVLAREHRVDAGAQPGRVGETAKQGERVVAHPVLRVVHRDPGRLRDEALAPGRIGGEEVADLHVRDLPVVALQRGPGLGGGRHRAERTSATA